MNQRGWRIGSLAVATAIAACSGATSTELFSNPETTQNATEPGPSSGTAVDPGTSSSTSTSSSGGATSSSSGGSTSSSSGGSTSSTSSTSGGPGPKDASVPDSTAQSSSKVQCGTTSCSTPGQLCCVNLDADSAECVGALACNDSDETPIRCDDRTDCLIPGQVCCASIQGSGRTKVECAFSCNSGGGTARARMCNPSATTDECTAIGLTCQPSLSLPGYSICK